mgnify:CR=1 FL=1
MGRIHEPSSGNEVGFWSFDSWFVIIEPEVNMTNRPLTNREAAKVVLEAAGRPLHYKEITHRALEQGLILAPEQLAPRTEQVAPVFRGAIAFSPRQGQESS